VHTGSGEVTPDANTGSLRGDGHNGEILLCGLSFSDSDASPDVWTGDSAYVVIQRSGELVSSLTTTCSGCPAPRTRDAVFITAL
jgi:hypothetical protein